VFSLPLFFEQLIAISAINKMRNFFIQRYLWKLTFIIRATGIKFFQMVNASGEPEWHQSDIK